MPKRKYVLKGNSKEKSKLYSKTEKNAKRIKREATSDSSEDEEKFFPSSEFTDEDTNSRSQSALPDFQLSDEEVEMSNGCDFSPACSSPPLSENEETPSGNYDGFASFLKSFNFMSDEEETVETKLNISHTTSKKSIENEVVSSDESICFKTIAEEDDWVPGPKIEKSFRIFPFHLHNYELVFFEHPNTVPLYGHLKVTLLSGKATICGYQLKHNQPVVVFSKKETGILSIVSNAFERNPLAFGSIRKGIQAQNVLKYKQYKKGLIDNCGPFTAVVSLQELQLPPNLQFLKLYFPQAVNFETKNKRGDISYTCPNSGVLTFGTEYEEIFDRIEIHLSKINKGNTNVWFEGSDSSSDTSSDSSSSDSETEQKLKGQIILKGSRILVHGPKKSGKSTMIRYFINKFLNKYSEVFHLETDPGQTEFTPPGVLSLTKITKPIFGPPYTHPMTPLKTIFVGTITPETSPPMHIRSVIKLIEYFNENCPHGILLVNTLGWIQGIGDMLLQVIKNNLNPVVDIQLLSELFPLTTTTDGGLLKCKLGLGQNSETVMNSFKGLDLREAALLSYLGKCQPYYKQPTYLNAIRPVCVCWDDIAVYNFNKRLPYTRFYEALNCSIVALCSVDESYMLMTTNAEYPNTLDDEPNNNCLGFGFVRAVDEERHLLYIVTPVNLLTLKKVNAILSGNITVPHSVILKQPIYDTGLYFTDASIKEEMKKEFSKSFHLKLKKGR